MKYVNMKPIIFVILALVCLVIVPAGGILTYLIGWFACDMYYKRYVMNDQ